MRRTGRFWLGIAGLTAVGAAAYATMRPGRLLDRATTFCRVPAWHGQQLISGVPIYRFRTNEEALVAMNESDLTTLNTVRAGDTAPGGATIQTPGAYEFYSVAPDGSRILAVVYKGSRISAVVLDRTGRRRPSRNAAIDIHCGSGSNLTWMPDSRHVGCLETGTTARVQIVDTDTGRSRYCMPSEKAITPDSEFLGFTPHGTAILAVKCAQPSEYTIGTSGHKEPEGKNDQTFVLYEVTVEPKMRTVRQSRITTPAHSMMGVLTLSPNGDRLFIGTVNAEEPSPLLTYLHRVAPFVPADTITYERAFVCDLNGSHLRDLGGHSARNAEPWVVSPTWTPDAKRIAFVYDDRIMTIPVD